MNGTDLIRKPLFQRITAVLTAILGIGLVILSLKKEVFLVVNGDPQQQSTYALTVQGFLRDQGIILGENDRLTPAPETVLWGDRTIFLNISNPVQIHADGRVINLHTAERIPENVLLEAGLHLFPKDRLVVDGSLAQENTTLTPGSAHAIQVLRATLIDLQTEAGTVRFLSDADILAEALEKEDIKIFEADQLSYPLNTPLDGTPLKVALVQSKPLLVHLPDETITIRTTADTIGTALAQAGVSLQGLDYSNPPETEPLPENDQVQIIRVKEEILLKQEQIDFTSEYQPADDLALDQLQILSGGEYGLEAQRLRIISENGVEISREVEKEWVIKDPVPRILGYGTKINLETANTPDGQITYWRKITAYATSYDSSCPGCDTITSSGTVLKKGTIAVRLEWYRYMKGARVYIPGYGFGTIEDVGGGVPWSANWVDLGYKKGDYVPWSENVTVYFLAPAPPPDNIMYVLY